MSDPTIEQLSDHIQTLWLIVAAALVLFMQAGFCCLEAGSVRNKNSINVALKNVIDLCASFAGYFLIGFALMFGSSQFGIIGGSDWMLQDADADTVGTFFFQATFCGTAATIVSGGIAERCRFLPYLLISLIISLLIYPVFGHWVWNENGWLGAIGFHDFAGSSVVHMVGAGVSLAGIITLGARAGRFKKDGSSSGLPASNMPLVAIGVVILTFGWIGFNGGSAALGKSTLFILVNTILAGCLGGLAALLTSWAFSGLARPELILNGFLGGLVAITACADCVAMPAALLIGAAGGIVVVISTSLMERYGLDDAVGAVPVHGAAGIAGILLTAVFVSPESFAAWNAERPESAQLSRLGFFGIQILGAVVCIAWSLLLGLLFWYLIGRITPLRIGAFEEQVGMNYSEHKVSNPIDNLTTACSLAMTGRQDEIHGHLDNAGDGDTAQLAAGIRVLIDSTQAQIQIAKQFASGLNEIDNRLQFQQRKGADHLEQWRQKIADLSEKLKNLRAYIDDHRELSSSLPLLSDLLENTEQKVSDLSRSLPTQQAVWSDLKKLSRELHQATNLALG